MNKKERHRQLRELKAMEEGKEIERFKYPKLTEIMEVVGVER